MVSPLVESVPTGAVDAGYSPCDEAPLVSCCAATNDLDRSVKSPNTTARATSASRIIGFLNTYLYPVRRLSSAVAITSLEGIESSEHAGLVDELHDKGV